MRLWFLHKHSNIKRFSCMEKIFFLTVVKRASVLLKVITVAWFSEWESTVNSSHGRGPSSDQKPFSHFFLEKSFCAHVSIFLPCWLVWSIPTSSRQHKNCLYFFLFFKQNNFYRKINTQSSKSRKMLLCSALLMWYSLWAQLSLLNIHTYIWNIYIDHIRNTSGGIRVE